MVYARVWRHLLLLPPAIAAASCNSRSDACKGDDQVSLLQTVTKVQKAEQKVPAYTIQTSGKCIAELTKSECAHIATKLNAGFPGPWKVVHPTGCSGPSCAPAGCYQFLERIARSGRIVGFGSNKKFYYDSGKTGSCSPTRKCFCAPAPAAKKSAPAPAAKKSAPTTAAPTTAATTTGKTTVKEIIDKDIEKIIKEIKERETYLEPNIRLKVTLKGAMNLENRHNFGGADAYCKIKLVPCATCSGNKDNTEKQSPVVPNSDNPVWNFKWETVDYNQGDFVQFECYDEDSRTPDAYLGTALLPLKRNKPFDGEVPLDRKGSLRVLTEWQSCKGDCEPMAVTMGRIAESVYNFGKQVGNFHMILEKVTASDTSASGKDHMALFKKKGSTECALAFSFQDTADWVSNMDIRVEADMCGYEEVHKLFAQETRAYFKSKDMVKFSKIITAQCGGEVYSVGHSFGGAVATIVAGCLNSPKGLSALGDIHKDIDSFKVKGLYTVGAPGVSKPPMHDAGGRCFAGQRGFNFDSKAFDPVPLEATKKGGYLHPKVAAVELHENDDNVLSKREFACSDSEVARLPYRRPCGKTDGVVDPECQPLGAAMKEVPSLKDQQTSTYVHRLKALFSE